MLVCPVASAAFASGEVIHDLVTGRLFYLNRTAAEVWRGLREVSAEEAIAHDLAARYVMDLPAARRDVLALIESLKQAGILHQPVRTALRRELLEAHPPGTEPAWSAVCQLGDVPVHVVCHPASVGDSLALLAAPAISDDTAHTSLVLFHHGDRLVLLRDGVLVRWTASAASARWQLLRQLVTVGYRRHWLALLHAAAVATPAGCLLLAGGSGAGKSTLLAGLLHAGLGFMADDILPLETGTQLLWRVPLAISIKHGSWSVVELLFPELTRAPTVQFADRRIRYLWPTAATLAAACPAGALLFPCYVSGAPTALTPVDALQALCLLGAEGSELPATDAGLAEFLGWLTRLPAYRLTYGHLDEAVAVALTIITELAGPRHQGCAEGVLV